MSEDILALPPPPPDARLAYGPEPYQFGELRLPSGRGPHPVAVALHGGYWRARYGLEYLGHLCAALVADGLATWNLEYRRLGNPGGGWPGTLQDVGRGTDHLRALAARYRLDLGRVVAVGHSAGGHLALWLAARHRLPPGAPLHSGAPLPLRGAISLAGVADLRQAWQLGLSRGAVRELLGGSPASHPERYAAASPVELLPLDARQVLVHGTEDVSVPYALSQSYYARAAARGDPVELVSLPAAGHFELVDPRAREWEQVRRAVLSLVSESLR